MYRSFRSVPYPVISVRISLVNVIITPPARVRNPFARCEGSWLLRERPTCMMPRPSRIRPIALIRLKMKSDRLFTTVIGFPAAKQQVANTVQVSTAAIYAANILLLFFLSLILSGDSISFFLMFLFLLFDCFKDVLFG